MAIISNDLWSDKRHRKAVSILPLYGCTRPKSAVPSNELIFSIGNVDRTDAAARGRDARVKRHGDIADRPSYKKLDTYWRI